MGVICFRMNMPPAFDAVLFDLDGVLIHSEPVSERALQAAARRFGFEVPDDAMPMFTGLPGHVVYAMVVERFAGAATGADAGAATGAGASPDAGSATDTGSKVDAVTLRALSDEIYESWLPDVPEMPGAGNLVRAFAAAHKQLALVTSSRRRQAETALTVHGLRAHFAQVIGAEDVHRTKPDPEPFLAAARALGVDPARCVVIEDSLAGCRSGAAAGCHVVGYPSSFKPDELLAAGAHLVLASHYGILDYLGR